MKKRKNMVKRTLFARKLEKTEKVRVIDGVENRNFCLKIGKREFFFVEIANDCEREENFLENG